MNSPATGLVAVIQARERIRALIRIPPPGDRLTLYIRPQVAPLEIAQLIVRTEVRRSQTRAALEANDLHARFAEFGREYPSRGSHTDNDDIRPFRCHGFSLLNQDFLAACRPIMGARVNACLLRISVEVKIA